MKKFSRPAMAAALTLSLVGVISVPASGAWQDNEWVRGAPVKTQVIPPAVIQSCTYSSLLGLGGTISIVWTLPAADSRYSYVLEDVVFQKRKASSGEPFEKMTTFNAKANTSSNKGVLTTNVGIGLLGGLLGLGAGVEIGLVVTKGNWSAERKVIKVSAGLLGGNPNCELV